MPLRVSLSAHFNISDSSELIHLLIIGHMFLPLPMSAIVHWMTEVLIFTLLDTGSFSIPITLLQLWSHMKLSYLKTIWSSMSYFYNFLGGSGTGLSLGWFCPTTEAETPWGLNPVPHQLWHFPVQLVGRTAIPGPVWASAMFPLILLQLLPRAWLVSSHPCPGTVELLQWGLPNTSGHLYQEPRSLVVSLGAVLPSAFSVLWTPASLVSLDSPLHLFISKSSEICLSFSPCTTARALAKGSRQRQLQGSLHLFPDTVLCCLMSSVLKNCFSLSLSRSIYVSIHSCFRIEGEPSSFYSIWSWTVSLE